MAAALENGRLGQLDLVRYHQYLALENPNAVYLPISGETPTHFVDYYSLDIGYSFIVEAARLAFPALPDNHLRALALQLLADAMLVGFAYVFFAVWDTALGALAALFCAGNRVFCWLVSFAFYYYWDIPLTLALLGLLLFSYRRPARAGAGLGLAGLILGFGVWLRASWWPLSCFFFALVLMAPRLRAKILWLLLIFGLVAAPQVYRSSRARGSLALSTRAAWHVALVGLGYYPNPYGLEAKDEAVFRLTQEKYGVPFRMEDYGEHDRAAKREFLSILRKDPRFVLGSFLGRLWESLLGNTATSLRPYPLLPSPLYRIVCLAGLILMWVAGGEKRLLGTAAAGFYLLYTLVTSLFYFVGLAYDNVSEVALFVLLMGGLDCGLRAVSRLAGRLQAIPSSMSGPPALAAAPH